MSLPGYNRVRHIHNRDSLDPDLIKCIDRVLRAAAGDLQSNIFLFPDVHSEANPPPEEDLEIYAQIRRELHDDPCDVAATRVSHATDRSLEVIWVSHRVFLPDFSEILRTGVLAHELGHVRQIEHPAGDVLEAWDCYEEFLKEEPPLPYWERPHEIDAELFARKVIRQLHPKESLDPLIEFYRGNYERVLGFESSGEFELLKYFKEVIRHGPSGLRDWILTTPNGTCRGNAILLRLAPE